MKLGKIANTEEKKTTLLSHLTKQDINNFKTRYDDIIKNPANKKPQDFLAVLDILCRYHKENDENGK